MTDEGTGFGLRLLCSEGILPPGTAPDEHFVLIVAFPRTPIYGGYPLEQAESFRRAKSEWVSEFPPGHWALGLQKFRLVRSRWCAWLYRANAPGANPGGRPKGLPYPIPEEFLESCRGGACPSRGLVWDIRISP